MDKRLPILACLAVFLSGCSGTFTADASSSDTSSSVFFSAVARSGWMGHNSGHTGIPLVLHATTDTANALQVVEYTEEGRRNPSGSKTVFRVPVTGYYFMEVNAQLSGSFSEACATNDKQDNVGSIAIMLPYRNPDLTGYGVLRRGTAEYDNGMEVSFSTIEHLVAGETLWIEVETPLLADQNVWCPDSVEATGTAFTGHLLQAGDRVAS